MVGLDFPGKSLRFGSVATRAVTDDSGRSRQSAGESLPIKNHRPDIDGLRAVAVLAVVANHAFPGHFRGGFVGVDVFFVISGMLITSIVHEQIAAGHFSFWSFYKRRIRRIFPALIIVLAFALAAGWLLLYPEDYKNLGRMTVASAAFMANIALWQDQGYFATASANKPLLHLWSLGVEEQFYLLWPVVLLAFTRMRISLFQCALVITVGSFLINLYMVLKYPQGAYYLPVSRFWEISLGGLLVLPRPTASGPRRIVDAFLASPGCDAAVPVRVSAALWANISSIAGAILLVIAVAWIDATSLYPGFWALIPVTGSLLLLVAGPEAWFNRVVLSSRGFVFIGLVSYSLYLWHWPLLTFAHVGFWALPGAAVRMALVVASLVLASLTWAFFENPLRFGANGTKKAIALCIALVAVAGLGYAVSASNGQPSRLTPVEAHLSDEMSSPIVLTKDCWRFFGTPKIDLCTVNSEKPDVVLFGDSHAAQLFPGLLKASNGKLKMVAVGYAPPFSGAELSIQNNPGHSWNRALARHEAVMKFIARHKTIRVAVLSAQWDSVADGALMGDLKARYGAISVIPRADYTAKASRQEIIAAALGKTIERLQSLGIKVIVVEDPPEIPSTIRNCLPVRLLAIPNQRCVKQIRRSTIDARKVIFDRVLRKLTQKYPSLTIVRTQNIFCDREWCHYMTANGNPVYSDGSHLNRRGSELIAVPLLEAIQATLRGH